MKIGDFGYFPAFSFTAKVYFHMRGFHSGLGVQQWSKTTLLIFHCEINLLRVLWLESLPKWKENLQLNDFPCYGPWNDIINSSEIPSRYQLFFLDHGLNQSHAFIF